MSVDLREVDLRPPVRLAEVRAEARLIANDLGLIANMVVPPQGWRPSWTEAARAIVGRPTMMPWWISPEMVDLVEAAAQTLPPDRQDGEAALMAEDVHGLAFFGRVPMDAATLDHDTDETVPVHALAWVPIVEGDDTVAVGVATITLSSFRAEGGHRWVISGLTFTRFAESTPNTDFNRLRALRLLAAQVNLAEQTVDQPDRAERRRAIRAGELPSVTRVIRLRRTVYADGDDSPSAVEFSHRWIVGGHWRSQPYGPGATLRRPTWIAPHVKGPQDAPLVVKDVIKALVR